MNEYPEHEKLEKVQEKSQAIGEFLEWLNDEKGLSLAVWGEDEVIGECLYPAHPSVQDLLAEFFGIDLQVLEDEKQAMLVELRRTDEQR